MMAAGTNCDVERRVYRRLFVVTSRRPQDIDAVGIAIRSRAREADAKRDHLQRLCQLDL